MFYGVFLMFVFFQQDAFSQIFDRFALVFLYKKFFVLAHIPPASFGHTLLVAWDGRSWALLGRSGELLGRFWGTPWLISGTLGALLGHSWALLGHSWTVLALLELI